MYGQTFSTAAALGLVGSDPGSAREFLVLTVASIFCLSLLPAGARRMASRLGIYVHELCHGVSSWLTGGDFHRFRVSGDGGVCVTSGGYRGLVLAAGYVGTVLLGAVFLARSAQSGPMDTLLRGLAIRFALTTLKAADLRTVAVGAAVAGVLWLCCDLVPGALFSRFLLNLMGVILVWDGYEALKTLWALSASRRGTGSDAEAMARWAGWSPLLWVAVFGGIAAVVAIFILRASV
jgi:hypothetical protein